MKNSNPTQTNAWKKLQTHFEVIKDTHLTSLFEDANRAATFTIQWQDFLVDYSKNRITEETKTLLVELAEEVGLSEAITSYFGGDAINATEDRAVMHTALRDFTATAFQKEEVQKARTSIQGFTKSIIEGTHKGATGKTITDVVLIFLF